MKKRISILLVLALMVMTVMASCGSSDSEEPSGTTYDAGEYTVTIPDGWQQFDFDAEEETTSVRLAKVSADEDVDDDEIYMYPYIVISMNNEMSMSDMQAAFGEVTEGTYSGDNYEWYYYTFGDYAAEVYQIEDDGNGNSFTVYVSLGSEDTIETFDHDVIGVVSSITVK